MTITVVIPTYRRPKDLTRCLEALKKQTRQADELLVIVRDTDTETWQLLKTFNSFPLALCALAVTEPGLIAALNTGLDAATGDIVVFTDDDAVARSDWLARIESYYVSDSCVGGVGGRDYVYRNEQLIDGARPVVGRVQWFGRTIGNHNLGVGDAREVDILKGVNMSFRRRAIAHLCFDRRLQGTNAQIHSEIGFCLALKKAGWTLIYDPKIAVDHYQGQRFDEEQRQIFNPLATTNIVHNHTLALLENLSPIRRAIFLLWAVLIGTKGAFGCLQFLRFLPTQGELAYQKWLASIKGRWQGWQTWRQSMPEALPEAIARPR
ncbi:MAG: glycosyltransferase family 2 protein [Cyanobacteriota bacterium]|nr:glycosyltransferase family 2 protein [Cyanobacteriota bacterium]